MRTDYFADSGFVGLGHGELAVAPVERNRQLVIAVSGDLEAPLAFGADAVQLHELLHPLLDHRDAARYQFALDARPAVGATLLDVQGLDMHQQRLVAQVAPLRPAGTAYQMRVVAGRADLQ